jgi:hypothetical protein
MGESHQVSRVDRRAVLISSATGLGTQRDATGLKSVCLSYNGRLVERRGGPNDPWGDLRRLGLRKCRSSVKDFCKFTWEQCMKSGFWEGLIYTAQPNAVKS